MKIFKFGGASVSSSESIKNISKIINEYAHQQLVMVVSAMGKTTNSLELLAENFYKGIDNTKQIAEIEHYHLSIIHELFSGSLEKSTRTIGFIAELTKYLKSKPSDNYDYEYDQIVSYGELLSTSIVSDYLNSIGLPNQWVDARNLIQTDSNFREGIVDWQITEQKIQQHVIEVFSNKNINIVISQGFIASNGLGDVTTLGREGSDYSAAIFGYSLNAEEVIIWKDVSGLLNADPKYFSDAVKLDSISYKETIELAYYGATIIHPKTIKPLQNKSIPLIVKSFFNHKAPGSVIGNESTSNHIPCYIFKRNQALISIYPIDFSFIAEENLSLIFGLFAHFGVKINLMQNSAISFSVCVDYNPEKLKGLIAELNTEFKVRYNLDLELITVRNYNQETIDKVVKGRKILTEQKSRTTIQLVVEE
ncbi:MAG: aspartate kinase [Bacteroidota bacterium]